MKFRINAITNSFDVDFKNELTLNAIVKYFQISAVGHTSNVGYLSDFITGNRFAWVLHRLHVKVLEYPYFLDDIHIVTWSRGAKGFFAYREFVMVKGRKKCAMGSSVWVLIDVINKKPVKIKKEIVEKYTVDDESAFSSDIADYKPEKNFSPDISLEYQIRYRDYDVNGHVNNSVYFELIEDAIYREYCKKFFEIKIYYFKEINKNVRNVQLVFKHKKDTILYSICKENTVFAAGEIFVS